MGDCAGPRAVAMSAAATVGPALAFELQRGGPLVGKRLDQLSHCDSLAMRSSRSSSNTGTWRDEPRRLCQAIDVIPSFMLSA